MKVRIVSTMECRFEAIKIHLLMKKKKRNSFSIVSSLLRQSSTCVTGEQVSGCGSRREMMYFSRMMKGRNIYGISGD